MANYFELLITFDPYPPSSTVFPGRLYNERRIKMVTGRVKIQSKSQNPVFKYIQEEHNGNENKIIKETHR